MELSLLRALAERLARGETLALVTVIETKGSVPRHCGSAMIQLADGSIIGTVGGGRGEAEARSAALEAIRSGRSRLIKVEMLGEATLGSEMICGGTSTLLIETAGPNSGYIELAEASKGGARLLLLRSLPEEGAVSATERQVSVVQVGIYSEALEYRQGLEVELEGDKARLALSSGSAQLASERGLFYDPILPEEGLLILGGGHVGAALARQASSLGFVVTVGDDRTEYLLPERFPRGTRTLAGSYAEIIADYRFDASTSVVIATRGHLFDLESVRAALPKTWRYLGFIGSSRKTRMILEQLEKDGADPGRMAALRAPIGLDIGAETPEEIAVSILAELIAARRNAPLLLRLDAERAGRRLPKL